ncbi:hypothetical protein LTR70_004391 [Exophiala xenobiotica]|uniref:FAD-binding FR-type domain-containing protein n=1 Tax=Lithohypha guttulata TaxID=1690604 RepID=A0ABR0KJC0_9EURO|nr:hypothetical protein LTR24_001968 [Lithohypha guttulata]KAK5320981.1 hypothetical protein LTR70_004391 [Exophiala xenobiotica]
MQQSSRSASFERILSWPPTANRSTLYANHATQQGLAETAAISLLFPSPTLTSVENNIRKPTVAQTIVGRWRINKSGWIFTTFVVILQLSFGSWQCYRYSQNAGTHNALGWGVGLAKSCAGALYPTMFFLILSMSRWTVPLLRNSAYLSGVINFDKFRTFHIRMAICAFVLSLGHTVGHLSGTFVHGSNAKYRVAVIELLGDKFRDFTYADFIYSLPGWTGVVAMYPALGFVLALPTFLVLFERMSRLLRVFRGQVAGIWPVNNDVVQLSFPQTKASRWWSYKVGQYVLIRMPSISAWEWHPFTISGCRDGQYHLYIKKSGEWTKQLSRLKGPQVVNVDGPFGAPCQQFYQYDHCIVIATGIGVTPCSAILDHMYREERHPWASPASSLTRPDEYRGGGARILPRFADFYWTVPGQEMLPWFAGIFSATATAEHNRNIGIRLQVYITRMKEKDLISKDKLDHMFSKDMDAHINSGRPDYSQLFFEHYEKMRFMQQIYRLGSGKKRVAVFFCGAKAARDQLRVLCYENTLRGVIEGSGLEYQFHPEVF